MKIVLVDGQPLYRVGVRQVLSETPGYEVVGEAGTAREAFKIIDLRTPDIVVMALLLPGMDGVLATREIIRRAPQARVLILTACDRISDVLEALDAGAAGYALKSFGPKMLIEAIAAVNSGRRYIAATLAPRLGPFEGRPGDAPHMLGVLSMREREVFRLASTCMTAGEMAVELCLSRKTVDTHLSRIHHKLGVRNRAELVSFAASLGMLRYLRTPGSRVRWRWGDATAGPRAAHATEEVEPSRAIPLTRAGV